VLPGKAWLLPLFQGQVALLPGVQINADYADREGQGAHSYNCRKRNKKTLRPQRGRTGVIICECFAAADCKASLSGLGGRGPYL